MLHYFLTLSDDEIKKFINTIPCNELSLLSRYTVFYELKQKYSRKYKMRNALVVKISPEIIIKDTDCDILISNSDINYYSMQLLITQKGIYNNKKFLFFKRKRMFDIEEKLIQFLVDKNKTENKTGNIKKFSFGKIRNSV